GAGTSALADLPRPVAGRWRKQRLSGNLGITCVGAVPLHLRGFCASVDLAMVRQNGGTCLTLHPFRKRVGGLVSQPAHTGLPTFSPWVALAGKIVRKNVMTPITKPSPSYPDRLTAPEVEVLRFIAKGWSDPQIHRQ